MKRTRHALVAVLLLASIPQRPSFAQTPAAPDESLKEEAITHFTKGVSLMKEEQFDAALAEFVLASKLYPLKNARRNAARCLRALGRFDEALVIWEAFTKEFASVLKPEEADEANKEIADLRGKVGSIVLKSNIDGATVVIDGRERGKTPLAEPVVVAIGTRVVRVAKEGYVPFEAKPIIAGKSTVVVYATLQPLARSGRIRVIEESGKTLDVVVDGAVVGKTPTYEGVLPPGAHVVVLRGEGRLGTQPAAANIVVDDTFVLRLKAEELKSIAQIVPEPAGATLTLDGVRLGNGTWEGALRSGTHRVDVSADGYFRTSKSFETHDDKRDVVKIVLERDENSPFWTKGKTYPFSIAAFGSGLFGASFGGEYEGSCSKGADCYARSRPFGFTAGLRAGYDVAPQLAIELSAGFLSAKMSVSRKTQLAGDSGLLVPVDIADSATLSGPLIGLGASFAFFKKPIVLSGALSAGTILARAKDSRNGTVTTDAAPTKRDLTPNPASDTISKVVPFIAPELRFAYPIGDQLQIGLSLGALIGITDARPKVRLQPTTSASDPGGTPKYNGSSIGFVPRGDPESAIGTFLLAQGSLFVRVAF